MIKHCVGEGAAGSVTNIAILICSDVVRVSLGTLANDRVAIVAGFAGPVPDIGGCVVNKKVSKIRGVMTDVAILTGVLMHGGVCFCPGSFAHIISVVAGCTIASDSNVVKYMVNKGRIVLVADATILRRWNMVGRRILAGRNSAVMTAFTT